MKRSNLFLLPAVLVGVSRLAFAVPCDGVTTCERPDFNGTTQSGWSLSASGVSNVKALVSVGPTGNTVGSQYYFGASSSDLGATVASGGFTPGGAGARVISTAFATNASQTPTATVSGGSVQQLLGATGYYFYAQACPSGTGIYNSAGCSAWTRIGNTTTSNYPSSVFSAPVAPTDSTTNSINVRTAVPTADQGNVSLIRLDINDLITPANNQTLAPQGFSNGVSLYPIDNTMYTQNGGFKPNVKYQYVGKVVYPYGVDVPSAGQTRGPIWTTPVQPGAVTTANVTHCSVQITATNSSGAPANPAYTIYNLCATGTCATDQISGATSGDTAVATITGLTPNTLYTPNATALVGNGDGSSSGWANSASRNGTNFTTQNWGGTFTVSTVTATSANFNVSGIIGAVSISTWTIRRGGANGTVMASGLGDPTGTHLVSGLTPNTQYSNLVIVLTETSGCSSSLPFAPTAFTTTPIPPESATFGSVLATSLQVTWVDSSANPSGSTYEVTLCTDSGFSAGCQTNTATKPTLSTTFTVSPLTTYFARVRTRNANRPTWTDSAWVNTAPASVTTPANQSAISVSPNPGTAVTGSPITFTATVTDQTGAITPGAPVNWSYSNGNAQLSTTNGVSTTLTATAAGSFTLTASLGGAYADVVVPVTVSNAGPAVSSANLTVNPNNLSGTLACVATDPGFAESTLTYTWSLESGPSAASFSANGTNAAKNATVTFSKAGNYVFRCTVTDPATFTNFALTPSRTVNQVLTSISVCPSGMSCPNSVQLRTLQDQQFVANGIDQFNDSMTLSGVTWSVTGAGSINSAGVFNSSQIGTNVTVRAQSGSISGAILVSLVSFDVSNAKAYPVPFKASQASTIRFDNLGSQSTIHIYTTSGRRVFDISLNANSYDWDVKNTAGESLASGVYFYVIESPEGKKNGKLIIIK